LPVKGNGWRPSPLAQAGWREKERTRTDAGRIMDVHIKTSALSIAPCRDEDTRRLHWAWRGHAAGMNFTNASSERGSSKTCSHECKCGRWRYRQNAALENVPESSKESKKG